MAVANMPVYNSTIVAAELHAAGDTNSTLHTGVIILCNLTIDGSKFQIVGSHNHDESKLLCQNMMEKDPDGAAMYAVVVITMFATAIGFFIGMMSFKKKKYDEWDRQAGNYLMSMYKRKLREEKELNYKRAKKLEAMKTLDLITVLSGVSERRTSEFYPPSSQQSKAPSFKFIRSMSTPTPDCYTYNSWSQHGSQEETTSSCTTYLLPPVLEHPDHTRLTIPDTEHMNSTSSITTGSVISAMADIEEYEEDMSFFNVDGLKPGSPGYEKLCKHPVFNV